MSDRLATVNSSPSLWRVGDVVDDLYDVLQVIESGGMGVVHRVHHRGWNIDLAVKTPKPELVSSPQQVTDFETEAETWVGLGLHPHVVACVYVRRLDGLPRVFAEWVEGGSLSEAVKDRRVYAVSHDDALARILDIAIQFAWGLDHAHSHGLVHQDVKPANLMLTAEWTAKVSDFGLAKARAAAGDTTTASTAVASVLAAFGGGLTPACCSPEQASAFHLAQSGQYPAALSRATDVWSWAISVWEMFAGEPPCRNGQTADEAFAAFREDPWVEDPAIPVMPDAVAELLGRCLDPEPATRPRRIGQIADVLAGLYQQLTGIPYPRSKPDAAGLLADGLNNQALSMLDLGRIEEAEQLWQQAMSADPQHLDALYNYGLHQWRAGQITDADVIDRLEAVRVSHPGPDAERLLAQVHMERRDSVSAVQLLVDAARAAPDDRALTAALRAAQRQPALSARTLTGHSKMMLSAAVSTDGRLAVSGSDDGTVEVWDLEAGECLHTLGGHTSEVRAVAVSADGRLAVSGGGGAVLVWDVDAGVCLRSLTGHTGGVLSVAMSGDGRLAVSGGGGAVLVWDVDAGVCLRSLTGHTGEVFSVAVSADGRLAVADYWDGAGQLRVWDVGSGICLRTVSTGVSSLAVSADGRLAVTANGRDNTVEVWDLDAGTCLRTLPGHTSLVDSVAVSADGRLALSGSRDETVRVWDLDAGTCLHTLNTGQVESVAVSADGRVAVAVSFGGPRVWEVPTARGHPAPWSYTPPHSAYDLLTGAAIVEIAVRRAQALLAAADGAGAAAQLRTARAVPGYRRDPQLVGQWRQLTGLGSRGRLLDAWPQRTLTGHTGRVVSVAVSADGRLAISAGSRDKIVRVWDVDAGACLRTLTGHTELVRSVAVSADGRLAVSGGRDGTVKVWDVDAGGTCLRTLTGPDDVMSVAMSADGRLAISGSRDETVRVWDVDAGRCLHTLSGHTDQVESVAVSVDGRLAFSGSADTTVRVWDLDAGRSLRTLINTSMVLSVAVSADGRVAVSGAPDKTVRVWDVDAGTCLGTLRGHTDQVESVAVSADGRVAISGNADATVRVWDLVVGACVRTLTGMNEVSSVALSADATVAVSGGADGTVRVWALDWDYEFPPQPETEAADSLSGHGAVTAVLRDTKTGHTYPITGAVTRIGRLDDNDIKLDGADVSDHHAAIIAKPTGYLIADLRSPNGVQVDGARIKTSAPLTDGAVIAVDGHEFILDISGQGHRRTTPSNAGAQGDSFRDLSDTVRILESQDGSSYSCRVVGVFELDGNQYALLVRTSEDDPETDEQAVIMRLIERDDQAIFETIEDDAEFGRVVAYVEDLVRSVDDED